MIHRERTKVLKNRCNNNRKQAFKKGSPHRTVYFLFFLLFSFLCSCFSGFLSPAQASNTATPESYSTLKKGKELLYAGKYSDAIESLKTAYDDFPVMKDYILFFTAKAYNGMARFDDSSRCIEEILKTLPDSPLKKRARALEINNTIANIETTPLSRRLFENSDRIPPPEKNETAIKYLESYVADYPEDTEMTFVLARLLKKLGMVERAKKLFVRVYTSTGPHGEAAYHELLPRDITPGDLLSKASNLMKIFEYKKAETILRKALLTADDSLNDEIEKQLGLSLFKQKRYREAGDLFLKTGDLYNGARSFYRTGDLNAFKRTMSRLISMDDKRAGSLLILYASKKRREGKKEEALDIFAKVKKKYPSHAEDARWGIAWTYYRSGDYDKALEALNELSERYPHSKYLYWKQRALSRAGDSSGKSISEVQGKTKAPKKDFYALLTQLTDTTDFGRSALRRSAWTPGPERSSRPENFSQGLPPDIRPALERFGILLALDMKEEAINELIRSSTRTSSPEVLLSLYHSLQEAGAYKTAITLASRFSDEKRPGGNERMDLDDILYPFAYWPTISEISSQYKLDPLILLSVIREESRFDPDARSVAGALGLMQIMPHTAYTLDKKLKTDLSENSGICDIRRNITIGAYYLNSLLKEFGSLPAVLAAYNAGEEKVREWLKEGNYHSYDEFIEDIPYDETRNYVKRVLLTYAAYANLGNEQ